MRHAEEHAFAFVEAADILLQTTSGIAPNGKVTAADLSQAEIILNTYKEAFVGGSILVDPEKSNDIDIVLPMIIPRGDICRHLQELGYAITMDAAYSEVALEMDSSWRKGRVNIIVINPLFYSAYAIGAWKLRTGAVYPTADGPILHQFGDRKDRVDLHVNMKSYIKLWIKDERIPEHADNINHDDKLFR